MASILLIDDDTKLTDRLREELEAQGHAVECLDLAEHAPERLASKPFDLVILDNMMPRMTGLEFLQVLRDREVWVPVIVMTGAPSSETNIKAIALEAFDYVIKPDDRSLARHLQPAINRALASIRLPKEVHVPGESPPGSGDEKLVGNSEPMREVYRLIGQFAKHTDPVLILGETGTGKELVAKAFRSFSPRKDKPFIVVDCTAIPKDLFESELFGHEKGVYTGADKARKGMVEHAAGGTLFLDEIGELPLDLQKKLLRLLQEHEIQPVGRKRIKVDIRVVSATNRDLNAECQAGTFREDLYFRLKGVTVELPPLRKRLEDLPELVDYFLARAATATGRSRPVMGEGTLERLRAYEWPGNVRELQHVLSRALGVCHGSRIMPADLGLSGGGHAAPVPTAEDDAIAGLQKMIAWAWRNGEPDLLRRLQDRLEEELLRLAREQLGGNKTKVAERLGVSWNYVNDRMKKYGLS